MKTNFAFIMLMVILATSTIVFASDMPSDPKKQTPWGLYVDSREAYEMKQKLASGTEYASPLVTTETASRPEF